jgi:hypothetical protein
VRGSLRPDWRSTDTERQAELRAVAGPAAVDGKDPFLVRALCGDQRHRHTAYTV